MKIAVIGGGIAALTCAALLQEAGLDVSVFAPPEHQERNSFFDPAMFLPYGVEESARLQKCFKLSEKYLADLFFIPDACVSKMHWRKCAYDEETRIAPFFYTLPQARALAPDKCPPVYAKGISANVYVMNAPAHLLYVLNRFRRAGGKYDVRAVPMLETLKSYDLIVNAAAVSTTFEDENKEEAYGGWDQKLIVPNPGFDYMFSSFEGRYYVYPLANECVIGGAVVWGAGGQVQPDPRLHKDMLAWAADLDPRFKGIEVIEERIGQQSKRPMIRLEKTTLKNGMPVIHNTGQGISSYALAWGCAHQVRDLILHPAEEEQVA